MSDLMGDRLKAYEKASSAVFVKRLPVILRVDGKCFSKYTKGCHKPFDKKLISAMCEVAKTLCHEIQGAQLAYVQSDEISILIHNYKRLKSEPWFGNKVQKMCSVAAGIASGVMTLESIKIFGEYRRACFDARVFVVPEAEVCNVFQWRQQDWQRNSIQMMARSLYSHKECFEKNNSQLKNMIHDAGKSWSKLDINLKRGQCIIKESYNTSTSEKLKIKNVTRYKWVVGKEIPIFRYDRNYIDKYLITEDE